MEEAGEAWCGGAYPDRRAPRVAAVAGASSPQLSGQRAPELATQPPQHHLPPSLPMVGHAHLHRLGGGGAPRGGGGAPRGGGYPGSERVDRYWSCRIAPETHHVHCVVRNNIIQTIVRHECRDVTSSMVLITSGSVYPSCRRFTFRNVIPWGLSSSGWLSRMSCSSSHTHFLLAFCSSHLSLVVVERHPGEKSSSAPPGRNT